MRVAMISRTTWSGGGASRFACDLSAELWGDGIAVSHFVHEAADPLADHEFVRLILSNPLGIAAYRASQWLGKQVGVPDHLMADSLVQYLRLRRFDLIHLHDIQRTLSPFVVDMLLQTHPVVWTMHDCSPFTGGCFYPMACTRYRTTCGECPLLGQWPLLTDVDNTAWIHRLKKHINGSHRLFTVAPSRWLGDQAVSSGNLANPPTVIPYLVDTNLFAPRDQAEVRREIGLPEDEFIVLLSAARLDDERKGIAMALDALRASTGDFTVLAVGSGTIDPRQVAGHKVVNVGFVRDRAVLSQYYAAANVFLFSSLADNLPTALLESQACGLPTVAFAAGGVPEIVLDGVNGWLAPVGDIDGLVAGMNAAFSQPAVTRERGLAGAERMQREYAPNRILSAHLDLYRKALAA